MQSSVRRRTSMTGCCSIPVRGCIPTVAKFDGVISRDAPLARRVSFERNVPGVVHQILLSADLRVYRGVDRAKGCDLNRLMVLDSDFGAVTVHVDFHDGEQPVSIGEPTEIDTLDGVAGLACCLITFDTEQART